jgi:hypothetical protein
MALHVHLPRLDLTTGRQLLTRVKHEIRYGAVRSNIPFCIYALGVLAAMAYLCTLLIRVMTEGSST